MLTQSEAKSLFEYDDGDLIWKVTLSNRAPAGSAVRGVNSLGYLRARVRGELYMAHRIVWLLHHGNMDGMLDHIDGNPANNRIANLRICDKSTNGRNSKIPRTNKSRLKGVFWNPLNENWRAKLMVNGKTIEVGSFPDMLSAAEAIFTARTRYHGDFARHY